MNDSVHQMSLLVGQIAGELKGLKDSVQNLNEVWGQREAAAADGRRLLHSKIETMQHDLQRVEAVVENVSRDIANTIKPAVEAFKTDSARKDGATAQTKKFVGIITLISGLAGGVVADLFHRWIGH